MKLGRPRKRRKSYRMLLCGTTSGCGVTTVAISVANYLRSCEKRKVCYMEFRKESKLVKLGTEGIIRKGVPGFRMLDLDVFQVNYRDMMDLFQLPYDVFVIDADSSWEEFWEHSDTLFSTDKQLILGQYEPWRYGEVQLFMKHLIQRNIDIKSGDFYGLHLDQKGQLHFREEFHARVRAVPEIRNPFLLDRSIRKWIGDLLKYCETY